MPRYASSAMYDFTVPKVGWGSLDIGVVNLCVMVSLFLNSD